MRRYGVFIGMVVLLTVCPAVAAGPPELPAAIGDTEMEIGDRLRLRATVMSADPVKQTLKVAEKEVRLLDTAVGGHTLKTRLLDIEGKPAEFASFKTGDLVVVLGYAGPDGHVYAMKIQRIDSTAQEPGSYGKNKSQLNRPKIKKTSPLEKSP
jgi:hypothetical protein